MKKEIIFNADGLGDIPTIEPTNIVTQFQEAIATFLRRFPLVHLSVNNTSYWYFCSNTRVLDKLPSKDTVHGFGNRIILRKQDNTDYCGDLIIISNPINPFEEILETDLEQCAHNKII